MNASPQRRAAERIRGFGTSIFSEISRMAVEQGAVNLGQGFPDFPAPDFVKEAARRAIAADRNQYAPSPGLPKLRAAIARRWQARHNTAVDPDHEVTVTQGATEALYCALISLLNPGDEVIAFEPIYDAYLPDIRLAGGVPRLVRLEAPDWRLDPDALRAAFSPRTRLLLLNSPHNPTGKVWTTGELDLIAQLCIAYDVIAVCDEVYSELVYAPARHVPLATRPGMGKRTITIDSIGKAFSVTGWKIGWAIAAPDLTAALRASHQWVTFCNPTPLQDAAAFALNEAEGNGYYDALRDEYQARRERLSGILKDAQLPTLPISGAYFLLSDVTGTGFTDGDAFCRALLATSGVAAIPPSGFYAPPELRRGPLPPLARFCFAKADATLDEAGRRLRERPVRATCASSPRAVSDDKLMSSS